MGVGRSICEKLRIKVFSDIGNTYSEIGNPISQPAVKLHLTNDTDVGILFSDDGVRNKYYLPAGQSVTIDPAGAGDDKNYIVKGTTFYVRHTSAGAPTKGGCTITVLCKPKN